MNPSERLRLLAARSSENASSSPHLPPSTGQIPSLELVADNSEKPLRPGPRTSRSVPPPTDALATPAEPLPNPFLMVDPKPPIRTAAAAGDLAPLPTGLNGPTTGLAADEASIDMMPSPDLRSDRDGGAATAEVQELVPNIEQDVQLGPLVETVHRASDVINAELPPCPQPDIGWEAAKPAGTHWSRASKLHLTPEMTAAESFRIIVFESLSHLTANHDCARLNLHIEGVHQCRIALRRLRSAFKTYRPVLLSERIQPIEEAVIWVLETLGLARDLDVLQTELLVPATEALGQSGESAALMSMLESKRASAYGAVSQALTNARYGRLLTDLCDLGSVQLGKWREACSSPDLPIAEVASPALTLAHQKLLKRGTGFETLSEAERHKVRIALKRLRYTLEFFATLFHGESKKNYIKRVARLQDDLGHMNDIAAANRMLAQLVGLPVEGDTAAVQQPVPGRLAFAAGGILGWHRRESARADRRLVKDWYAFVQCTPFWSR